MTKKRKTVRVGDIEITPITAKERRQTGRANKQDVRETPQTV